MRRNFAQPCRTKLTFARATSFAFRFLADVFKKIEHDDVPYLSSLRSRILRVCEGHITWLRLVRGLSCALDDRETDPKLNAKERCDNLLPSGCFAANYWPTGKIIPRSLNSWQPRNAFTDTAFQVLKIVDYMRLVKERAGGISPKIRELLYDTRIPWLYELSDRDRRHSYAWPHAEDEGINTFRLDDHYWIWKALESLESIHLDSREPQQPGMSSAGETRHKEEPAYFGRDEWLRLLEGIEQDDDEQTALKAACDRLVDVVRRLRSSEVQRRILQRFTTENDLSRQRMLALTRSPRETRFLLHGRDTALFYKQDKSLFPDTALQELWAKTLESQVSHEENEDSSWVNTLRYGLGILVATSNYKLNKRSVIDLLRNSVEVVIRLSTHTGFIHGELEAETHQRLLFTEEADRDYYYHVSFEIPYVLLTCAQQIDEAFRQATTHVQEKGQQQQVLPSGTLQTKKPSRFEEFLRVLPGTTQQSPSQPHVQVEYVHDNPADTSLSLMELQKLRRAVGKTQDILMKKAIPFSGLIDVRNIINIPEEWLYDYPEFLFSKDLKLPTDEKMSSQLFPNDDGSVVRKGSMTKHYYEFDNPRRDASLQFPTDTVTFVAQAPKQKLRRKRERRRQDDPAYAATRNNKELWSVIGKKRTAEKAKKRFVWLPHPNPQTAFLCWFASTEGEQPKLSLFFDRHARYEQHIWDSTSMILNSWQTELHLSFYTLVRKDTRWHVGIPDQVHVPFPSGAMELRRASMGFRFDGDLFDRYWTCHFIQYVPSLEAPAGSVPSYWTERVGSQERLGASVDTSTIPSHKWDFEFDQDASGRFKEKHWWQRKVLELYLLTRILEHALDNSARIRDEVKGELGIKGGTASFTTLNSEAYASSKDNWKAFERILQGVDEDLTSMLKTLEQWATREKDRSPEQPRWTRNDERKYRSHINKFRGATERQVWHLEMRRDEVRKLRDTLDTSMDKIRTDLELKREENIRYFTYVTVIFLPLGFAASFYSMVRGHS